MSQCGDQNDIFVYVLNVFIGIAIAVYFLPCKKITLYIGRKSCRTAGVLEDIKTLRLSAREPLYSRFEVGFTLADGGKNAFMEYHEVYKTCFYILIYLRLAF